MGKGPRLSQEGVFQLHCSSYLLSRPCTELPLGWEARGHREEGEETDQEVGRGSAEQQPVRGGEGGSQENRPGLGRLGMHGVRCHQLAAECTPQPFRAESCRLSSALHSIWSHSSWAILSHPGLLPLLGHLLGLRPESAGPPS